MSAARREQHQSYPDFKPVNSREPKATLRAMRERYMAEQRNDSVRPARRDDPDAAPVRHPWRRRPRDYDPRDARLSNPTDPTKPPPRVEDLDRWDAEWRDEWDRGDIDDSDAYRDEDELDVAEQPRDVEWLLDALDALDDNGDDERAFEWSDENDD